MSVEELLRDRYKVVAPWPNMWGDYKMKVGDILTATDMVEVEDNKVFISAKEFLKRYPHLFKKLEWYEERNLEDMPQTGTGFPI